MHLFDLFQSPWVFVSFNLGLGLIIGSFLSMLTARLGNAAAQGTPVSLSDFGGRSHCPDCETTLPWYRLIPLLSWVLSRGRCHACHNTISRRYPLIEGASAVLLACLAWQFGPSLDWALFAFFSVWLLTLAIIDWEHHLLLDALTLPLLWMGLMINTQGWLTPLPSAVWGAVVGYLLFWTVYYVFYILTRKQGMGFGDFKLSAALGAWFGWMALPQIILVAALSSLSIALLSAWLGQRSLHAPMAFGPFLALGGLSVIFWPFNP